MEASAAADVAAASEPEAVLESATEEQKDELKSELKRKQEENERLSAEMQAMKSKMAKLESDQDMNKIQDKKLLKYAKAAQENLIDSANSMTISEIFVNDAKKEKGKGRTIRALLCDYHSQAAATTSDLKKTRISEMAGEAPVTSEQVSTLPAPVAQQPVAVSTTVVKVLLQQPSASTAGGAASTGLPGSSFDYSKANEVSNKIMEEMHAAAEARRATERKKAMATTTVGENTYRLSITRKSYFDVTKRHRGRLKNLIKNVFSKSSRFLRNMGLALGEIVVNPAGVEKELEIEDDFKLTINKSVDENKAKTPSLYNLLYYKDKHSISDRAYNDLRTKCFLDIPTTFMMKKRRIEIDKMFDIHNNRMGVFVSMEHKLRARLESFFLRKYGSESEFDDSFKDNIIHIKLGADGTNIGRNLKLLNFTFTIMNEGARAKTATGNYTIGIYEIEGENHASLSECFKELIDEIEQMNEITIGNKTLKVVYYLGADWKMLSISLGILAANSKFPCVWCKCPKEEFSNYDADWSIVDTNLGARSHEEIAKIHENVAVDKNTVKYGHERKPLFREIIPIKRYMIDMLHLFLRISDTLFNLLIKDCSFADGFDMTAINKFDVTTYKHMNSLEHFLNERCSVRFSFMWIPETKKLTWRDLVGPEKTRLFENFNLAEIIPDHPHFESVSKLWTEFYEILKEVKQVCLEPYQLRLRTTEWLRLYLTVYNKTTITPYMHAFVSHLHEFVFLYKDINAFNCQGLEKLNDLSTGQYFKATNKHDTALHQMLKKRNRMEYLSVFVFDDE